MFEFDVGDFWGLKMEGCKSEEILGLRTEGCRNSRREVVRVRRMLSAGYLRVTML